MIGPLDHVPARLVLRRMVVGDHVEAHVIEEALVHLRACEICTDMFEVERTKACGRIEESLEDAAGVLREGGDLANSHPAVAGHVPSCMRCSLIMVDLVHEPDEWVPVSHERVDPMELFDRASPKALKALEPVARAQAAEQLGSLQRVGVATLKALADVAADDNEKRDVRAAALSALDRLDKNVSIPQRVIEEWAAAPARAGSFIAGVLERLAKGLLPSVPVTALAGRPRRGRGLLTVSGAGEITGSIGEEGRDLWLRLGGLPEDLERTQPVVAVPRALAENAPALEWSGEQPGLVSVPGPVTDGAMEVLLGSGAPPGSESLFRRMYLLSP
jgi:hypothetical protein